MGYKRILGICISVFACIFLMSHNTSAAPVSESVVFRKGEQAPSYRIYSYLNGRSGLQWTSWRTGGTMISPNTGDGNPNRIHNIQFRYASGSDLKAYSGDIIEVGFTVRPNYIGDNWFFELTGGVAGYCKPIDNEIDSLGTQEIIGGVMYETFYLRHFCVLESDTTNPIISIYFNGQSIGGVYVAPDYISIWKPSSNGLDYTQVLNDIKNNTDSIREKLEEQKEQEKEEYEQQASESSTEAEDQAAAASDSGESLLSVFGSVIGAIVSTTPTTCTFDSHLPFMSGNGTIDLCSIPVPPIVQTIASLIALAIFVPFGLHMFNRFVGIIRSFQ